MMSTHFYIRILVLFLMLAGVSACKSTELARSDDSEQDMAGLEEMYWSRVEQARMSSFTEADVHFMTGMIAHHAQALVISALAPGNGANAEVQRLAARIINAQRDEIQTMQRWLRDRDQPVPEIEIEGLDLRIFIDGEPYMHHMHMPGVLSQEQLVQLSEAHEADFDRLFLFYMIEHHSGAVTMVDNLINTAGAAQDREAFQLASAIQVDQITEIERMNLMLNALAEAR